MKNTNALKLTVYLRNYDKSKHFRTTETHEQVIGLKAAAELLKNLYKREGIFFPDITKAFYNGARIIDKGYASEAFIEFLI